MGYKVTPEEYEAAARKREFTVTPEECERSARKREFTVIMTVMITVMSVLTIQFISYEVLGFNEARQQLDDSALAWCETHNITVCCGETYGYCLRSYYSAIYENTSRNVM